MYLVRSVVDDKIHHELHVSLLELTNEFIDIFEFAEQWVDVFVISLKMIRIDRVIEWNVRTIS